MRIAFVAAAFAAAAALAPPAVAADVARVPLGSAFGDVVAGTDGGAWVVIHRRTGDAVGRANPDASFRTTALDTPLVGTATLGPDGQAWFRSGLRGLVRVDTAGNASLPDLLPALDGTLDEGVATGADGTLWTTMQDRIAHVTTQGAVTFSPLPLASCGGASPQLDGNERASDGALWISDIGCGRLIRVPPSGAPPAYFRFARVPDTLAADASGGMWFTTRGAPPSVLVHADAGGKLTHYTAPERYGAATDVAVAADGSAWLAFGACSLGRLAPGGALQFTPAPIPARRLVFDPAGGLWLASRARLVHAAPGGLGGACDDTPPRVRVLSVAHDRISVAALRRAGGFRIAVREPADVTALGFFQDTKGGETVVGRSLDKVVPAAHGGTALYAVPAARLKRYARRVASGEKVSLSLYTSVYDREGNLADGGGPLRLVP